MGLKRCIELCKFGLSNSKRVSMRKDLAIMGAATDLGQGKAGTELAPSWLRLKGSSDILTRKYFSVEDLGDITPENQGGEMRDSGTDEDLIHDAISLYNQRLATIAQSKLSEEKSMLTFGGDHSIAIGTLAGTLQYNPNAKVVWVDAHADINTPASSPSGNVHGMPLAFFFDIVKNERMKELFSWVPSLKRENLVYIGLRDVDPGERKIIKDLGITAFYAEDVLEIGIEETMEQTLSQLCPQGNEELHLSFDVDGLDPLFIPATGTPVTGGLSLTDGQYIVNTLMRKTNLISFDLVEVNPMLGATADDLELTARSVNELLEAIPAWNEREIPMRDLLMSRDNRLSPEL